MLQAVQLIFPVTLVSVDKKPYRSNGFTGINTYTTSSISNSLSPQDFKDDDEQSSSPRHQLPLTGH